MANRLTDFNVASIFSAYASIAASVTFAQQLYHQFTPEQFREYIERKIKEWIGSSTILDSKIFKLVIKQRPDAYQYNYLYDACESYLSAKIMSNATHLEEGKRLNRKEPVKYGLASKGVRFVEYVNLDENHTNVKLEWKFSCKNDKGEEDENKGKKMLELSGDLQYKDLIFNTFIPAIVLERYDRMTEKKTEIFLFTYNGSRSSRDWNSVPFRHPFAFDSLALDPMLKKSIVDDLDMFIRRKGFYRKIGRPWKKGYLLYGPPGTGKSSLIAAIANYLKFCIYDLQLATIPSDSVKEFDDVY